MLGVFVLGFLSFCTLIGIAYAMTPVPQDPTVKGVNDQGSTFYFRDGKTVIGKIGTKRQKVSIKQVPPHVQDAVLAAENRSFRSDPGFNTKAIARAVWVNATGGSTQGGSTITQQLAKNYYSDMNNRTMKRKFQELFISIKLEDKLKDKDHILELYLNTIYFGRNTYGIQAAAQEYYGKDVGKLTKQEAAMLAGIIQNPNRDPASKTNRAWAEERYKYVLDGLVKMNKLDSATAEQYKTKFPAPKKLNKNSVFKGQNGYLLRRSINALAALGITEKDLGKQGFHIVTTWDQGRQNHMAKVVKSFMKKHDLPKSVHVGTTSIDASSGEILAAYGGSNYLDQEWDDAYNSHVQAGSSFKAYVLAAALKQGIGLKSVWDTNSPMRFLLDGSVAPPGQGFSVRNASGHGYGPKDLIFSTANSLNTVYYPLGLKVGLDNVVETSVKAGLAKDSPGLSARASAGGLSLGIASVSPLDQASAYSTFANGGKHKTPHSIKRIYTDAAKKKPYKKQPIVKETNAFGDNSAGVAADVTAALRAVVMNGTGVKAQLPNAPVAGKTGTTNEAKAVWFVGYTPKISTSVGMWRQKDTSKGPVFVPLQGIGGYSEVHGGDLPAAIWHDYMAEAATGDQGQFPLPANVGDPTRYATTKPSPSVSETPICKPGQVSRPRNPCKPDPSPSGRPCIGPSGKFPPGCDPNLPPTGRNKFCREHPNVGPPLCPRKPEEPTGPTDPTDPTDPQVPQQGIFARPPD